MSGLIAEGERKAGTTMTVSPDTLEPFAFHAAFVGSPSSSGGTC
jgi:hypothetical protein